MIDSEPSLDFSTVIASTVHDMKNSLAMLMQAHSQWLAHLPDPDRHTPEQGVIDFEFAHLNGMLVQLLGLYKLGVNQMPLQPAYHELDDFIEAQLAAHQEVFASRGIIATYEVDPLSPLGFFDRELIASVLANSINNAIRYARHALLISVSDEAGQLVLTINDDGEGFSSRDDRASGRLCAGHQPQQWQHRPGPVLCRTDCRVASAQWRGRTHRNQQWRPIGRWCIQPLPSLNP